MAPIVLHLTIHWLKSCCQAHDGYNFAHFSPAFFAGQPRKKVVQSYLPTIFYYKYIVSISERRFWASARYLFHSRSHLAAYPYGFAKEIVRLALFLVPGGHRIFYFGKKSLFLVMSGLGRFFNHF